MDGHSVAFSITCSTFGQLALPRPCDRLLNQILKEKTLTENQITQQYGFKIVHSIVRRKSGNIMEM